MTDELLEAVDDLTLPKNVRVATDDGHTWATEDALLVQLAQAVSSTLNSGSGSGGSPWTRNVLDSGALYQAGLIRAAIGDWCKIAGTPVTRDPVVDLRAWYETRAKVDEDHVFYVRQMHAWAAQIRAMTNPPKTVEITAACPACDQGQWTNDQGERIPNPLLLTYRPETGSIWDDAKALCRACDMAWEGEWRLRELRHDVDAKEAG